MPIGPQGSSIYLAKRVLTDAEIKTLPTAPVEIIPAPGADKTIWPISARVILDNSAGVYDAPPGAEPFWQLAYLTSPNPTEASGLMRVTALTVAGIWDGEMIQVATFNSSEGYLQTALTGAEAIADTGLAIADIYNGVVDYTGGNAANTLEVQVLYAIVGL